MMIFKYRAFSIISAVALSLLSAIPARADEIVRTKLSGYQETPSTINSAGSGDFRAVINSEGTAIDYVLHVWLPNTMRNSTLA